MDRPMRSRKSVNYSDFQENEEDEDFTSAKAPPTKKPRVSTKDGEKMIAINKTPSQEAAVHFSTHKPRISVDDKLYERDLEEALQLSIVQTNEEPEVSAAEKCGNDQSPAVVQMTDTSPLLSNCSVDSSLLGLDMITDESGTHSIPSRQRQAASKAAEQQRRMLKEERDNGAESGEDEAYKPSCSSEPDSASDPDFSEKDGSDEEEEFVPKKAVKKKSAKKETPSRPQPPKKEKRPPKSTKPKQQAAVTPTACRTPSAVRPASKRPQTSSVSKPSTPISPAGGRLGKWNPPAQVGKSSSVSQSPQVRSPGQGLRLGLSRLARVKSLHPSIMQ